MSDNHIKFTIEKKTIEKPLFLLAKEDTIKCGNCGKELLRILQGQEDPTITTVILVECPYCNDSSFKYKVQGKIYIQAADGLNITDMPMDIINDIRYTTIKVFKNA